MEQLFQQALNPRTSKILAIGKNYLKHVKEMGGNDIPKEPVIFQKPSSSIISNIQPSQRIVFASLNEIHHEIELGFMVSKEAQHLPAAHIRENWQSYVGGYFLGLDLTDRTLQGVAKKNSFPWDISKGQDKFFPISKFIPPTAIKDPYDLTLHLRINGKTIQKDSTQFMHFKISDQLEYVSKYMTLYPGDLFLTGTPEGVGQIRHGDHLIAELLQGEEVLASIDFIAEFALPTL